MPDGARGESARRGGCRAHRDRGAAAGNSAAETRGAGAALPRARARGSARLGRDGRGVSGAAEEARPRRGAKVLHGELSGDPVFVERFLREAQALAKLAHSGIVAHAAPGARHRAPALRRAAVRARRGRRAPRHQARERARRPRRQGQDRRLRPREADRCSGASIVGTSAGMVRVAFCPESCSRSWPIRRVSAPSSERMADWLRRFPRTTGGAKSSIKR